MTRTIITLQKQIKGMSHQRSEASENSGDDTDDEEVNLEGQTIESGPEILPSVSDDENEGSSTES